jgi:hypothetical protein
MKLMPAPLAAALPVAEAAGSMLSTELMKDIKSTTTSGFEAIKSGVLGMPTQAFSQVVRDILTEALSPVFRIVSSILKLLSLVVMPFTNLLIPLILPMLFLLAPIVRFVSMIMRPVMQAMMEAFRKNKGNFAEAGKAILAGDFAGATEFIIKGITPVIMAGLGAFMKIFDKILPALTVGLKAITLAVAAVLTAVFTAAVLGPIFLPFIAILATAITAIAATEAFKAAMKDVGIAIVKVLEPIFTPLIVSLIDKFKPLIEFGLNFIMGGLELVQKITAFLMPIASFFDTVVKNVFKMALGFIGDIVTTTMTVLGQLAVIMGIIKIFLQNPDKLMDANFRKAVIDSTTLDPAYQAKIDAVKTGVSAAQASIDASTPVTGELKKLNDSTDKVLDALMAIKVQLSLMAIPSPNTLQPGKFMGMGSSFHFTSSSGGTPIDAQPTGSGGT